MAIKQIYDRTPPTGIQGGALGSVIGKINELEAQKFADEEKEKEELLASQKKKQEEARGSRRRGVAATILAGELDSDGLSLARRTLLGS